MNTQTTVNHLQGLLRLYKHGYQSDVIDLGVSKLLETEMRQAETAVRQLRQRLEKYEQTHKMIWVCFIYLKQVPSVLDF